MRYWYGAYSVLVQCVFGTGAVRIRYWCGSYSVLVRFVLGSGVVHIQNCCGSCSVLSRFACSTVAVCFGTVVVLLSYSVRSVR